jgi:AcrR family transcriptional regulator
MSMRANNSKERILQSAEAIVLQNGFAGTTIEHVIDKAAISKGGFFYHFEDKNELAKALVTRYIRMDTEVFLTLSERADTLSEDPLQRTLIFLNLFTEMVVGLTDLHPGCLVASFVYETGQLSDEIREIMHDGMLEWREIIKTRLTEISKIYTPRTDVSVEKLADNFLAHLEGGIILARVYKDNQALADQVQSYRAHLRFVFGEI